MKCKLCRKNDVIDFTDNVAGLCTHCKWDDIRSRYDIAAPMPDVDNIPVDERRLDWQRLVDEGDRTARDYE